MTDPAPRAPTVFLSYASQDREAARRIGDALPGFGLEVWYDESELGGGDAWDQKIRRQIRECDYFMPLVSAQTESRHEGYFRREWRLAVERTLDMADDHPYLLPVVLDDTDASRARVPDKFFTVQWLKVPDGVANPALEAACRRLVSGEIRPKSPSAAHPLSRDDTRSPAAAAQAAALAPPPPTPQPAEAIPEGIPFPTQEPGKGVRFAFEVMFWCIRSLWVQFKRLPRWIRWILIVWFAVWLLSHDHPSRHEPSVAIPPKNLDEVAKQVGTTPQDLAKLGATIAKQLSDSDEDEDPVSLLVMPFIAPAGDTEGKHLAKAAFTQTYRNVALTLHRSPRTGDSGITQCDQKTLVSRGQAKHTRYVLCGIIIEAAASAPASLVVSLIDAKAEEEIWNGHYPVAGADAAKIGQEVAAQIPSKASAD